jgi:DNA-binding NtrC family response regulator
VEHFVRHLAQAFNRPVEGVSPEALAALRQYRWRGNVRELQNIIERCVVLAEGPTIQLNDLPLDILLPEHRTRVRAADTLPLKDATEQFERQIILRVLERVKGNQSEAARILGVHRNSLKRLLARWSVE